VYPSKLKHEVYAMYSSVIGGIVTKPEMMSVPIDDHMVHRGRTFKRAHALQHQINNNNNTYRQMPCSIHAT